MKFPYAMIQTVRGPVWYEDHDALWKYDQNTFEQNDKIELMQFTGLRDRNDKEIYEGDIVRVMGENWEVSYRPPQFVVERPEKRDGRMDVRAWREWAEVIGNIYENPELLGVRAADASDDSPGG